MMGNLKQEALSRAGGLVMAGFLVALGPASASAPVAISPGEVEEAVLIAETCPTFNWTSVDGAKAYELVAWSLSEGVPEGTMPDEVIEKTLPRGAQGWTPPMAQCFLPGGVFAWAVRAVEGEGVGEWSEPALFTVAAGPTEEEFQEAMVIVQRYLGSAAAQPSPGADLFEIQPSPPDPGDGLSTVVAGIHSLGTARAAINGEPSATSGNVVGIRGVVNSAEGAAGVFHNTAGGTVLSGLGGGVEVLRVESSGDVIASSFSGDGSALTNLDAANLGGTVAISSGGTGATTPATARANIGAAGSFAELSGTLESDQLAGTYGNPLTFSSGSNSFSGDGSGLTGVTSSDPTKVAKTGDTMTGLLNLSPANGDALTITADVRLFNSNFFRNGDLFLHESGNFNTGVGTQALESVATGSFNTAVGRDALRSNISGSNNTAVGQDSLEDSTGSDNTAIGQQSLNSNTSGRDNTALGKEALRVNTLGDGNTAVGEEALELSTGDGNIALGENAGRNLRTGDQNIHIGHPGIDGESNTLRVGLDIDRAFVDGIRGVTTGSSGALPVMVDLLGQLGTLSSSRRSKTDIRDIDNLSSRLLQLRPVAFRYADHIDAPSSMVNPATLQYGLIAEEVEGIFPELVVHDHLGRPETVRYHLLSSLLLNELQKQQRSIAKLSAKLAKLQGLD